MRNLQPVPRRVSVQAKLLAAFGLVVALMLGVGSFALVRLNSDNEHLTRLASTVVPSTRAVGDINALMNKYRKDQLHYVVARPEDRPLSAPGSIAGDLKEDRSLMAASLASYRSHGLIQGPVDRRLYETFSADFARYLTLTSSFARLADRGQVLRAGEVVGNGAGDHEWDRLKTVIAAWGDFEIFTADSARAASESSFQLSVALILVLLLIAVAIAGTVAITLARRTTRTVRQIGTAAKAIATGDIAQHVVVESRDEFGEMAADFDSMIDYLRSMVSHAEAIAAGKLDRLVHPRSERDALGNALVTMTESLRRLVGENERLLLATREEADTDALTGLRNRRALIRDLDAAVASANASRPLVLYLFDLDGFKHYNDTFGHPAGDALLARLGERLHEAVDGDAAAYRIGGDEFCVLATGDANVAAATARRAANALSETGEAFTIGCSYGSAEVPREALNSSEALGLADQRMYGAKVGRVSAGRQSTDVLLKVLSERHPELGEHIGEVAQLASATARILDLPENEVTRIELAAQLHDIGKIAIPEAILNKPGKLTAEEWAFMRRHTEIGERIIAAAPALAFTAELIRSHHERFDGSGYPDHLAGDDIPLGACVIAVCDAFDAMTSQRAYSDAMSVESALAELKKHSGTQFHPRVVDAFLELIAEPALAARVVRADWQQSLGTDARAKL
jgi:diguanylate cyclase (GGDEF)-like protein